MDKKDIKKLSSTVLQLKFMKKSKERALREEEDEKQLLYADQLSSLNNSVDTVVLLGSHYDVMTYLPCRLSFGGMEPNIEKLNADKLTGLYVMPKEEEEEEEKDVDVTKEEMAEHFVSLGGIRKKFMKKKGKNKNNPKKRKSKGSPRPVKKTKCLGE